MHTNRTTLSVHTAFLLAVLATATLGFAQLKNPSPSPSENPPRPGQTTLGKLLFWEEQMSFDNTMACGTCHMPEQGGADPRLGRHPGPDGKFNTADDVFGSPGVVQQDVRGFFAHEGVFFPRVQVTDRAAPSAINAGVGFEHMFWDGRVTGEFRDLVTNKVVISSKGTLEAQAADPPRSTVEMAAKGQTWTRIADKLKRVVPMALATNLPPDMSAFVQKHKTYPAMFKAVYGTADVTPVRIVYAIANYERTLVSDETVVDLWLRGKISNLPARLQPGHKLYIGDARCSKCHDLPWTHDKDFHNIGVTPEDKDPGRYLVTKKDDDKGKFKTPGIRNAKLRKSFFHNGGKKTLTDVIEFYDKGGDFANKHLDGDMVQLLLTAQEKRDLLVFLEDGLTDPRVEKRQFPFDRPTLRSELPSLNSLYGVASKSGSGKLLTELAHLPAVLGNSDWLLGAANARASSAAFLVVAGGDANGVILHPSLPVPVNVDMAKLWALVPISSDASGVLSMRMPVPMDTRIKGLKFYNQFVVADPMATTTGGLYGSRGIRVEIF